MLAGKVGRCEKLEDETYRELVKAEEALTLREFEDYSAMEDWIRSWSERRTALCLVAGEPPETCSDIAEEMVRDARTEGYLVSVCLVDSRGMVYGTKVSNFVNHAGCLTQADGYYWYVEPLAGNVVKIVKCK